jgi:hypothetical protein
VLADRGNLSTLICLEELLILSFEAMQGRSFELFTLKEHLNTVAPIDLDTLLVVLHNHGEVSYCCT